MFKSMNELCDVVSHAIYCDDSTLLLTLEANTNEYWIPSSKVNEGVGWFAQSVKDMEDIFGTGTQSQKLLRLYKIWTPNHVIPYIYHCIFLVKIANDLKRKAKTTYGKYRGKVRWVQENELNKMLQQETLRSSELIEFFLLCKETPEAFATIINASSPTEMIYCGNFIEISDKALVNGQGDSMYDQIVSSASFTKEVQSTLYKEFLFFCFPATYMCQQVFSRFILQIGWTREEAPYIFRAADISNRCALSFREFMYVLAAMEPTTSHGGSPAELRCRYIFRMFDRDRDGSLNFNEFKNLISCIRKSKKQVVDPPSVTREAEACYKTMDLTSENQLNLGDFLHAVGDLKLRGTSQIFRSPSSVVQLIQELQDRENKQPKASKPVGKTDNKPFKQMKSEAKNIDYELGEHTIRLQKSGTLISIDQIWNLTSAVSGSSTHPGTINDIPYTRRKSQDQFSQTSITNEVLKSLRYLMQLNKGRVMVKNPKTAKQEPYSWGQLDMLIFSRNFISICMQVRNIFKGEPRLVEIQAPVYVMGDLHGNFASLLYFEKVLWHLGPGLCPCNLLFLGDYVDRGPYSLEVISYLFSYKVQTPGKLILLRGNHEIRDIQKMFTFQAECINKFGDKIGMEVWNAVNSAFDTMPISASIDGKIFCCHGGIPPPWLCPTVATINSIPCPLTNPDDQSALAWEIMWNDPIRQQKQVTEEVALELMANDGFAVNVRRGTAHIFSVEALERFLNNNGYSHIIRAHEVAQAGFNVLQKGKLLTVFSSSKYCGGANEAACILADQGKLRILRMEPA